MDDQKKLRPGRNAFPVDRVAFALGIGEFSLFWRIRGDEITTVRAKSGEMMVPQIELERLSCSAANPESFAAVTMFPDERLGIERLCGAATGDSERLAYKVLGTDARFTENEINSYRAAFGAIAREFESLSDLKKQLMNRSNQVSHFRDVQVNSPEAGIWEVRSVLLNLNPGEILLCHREDGCAVIERFQGDSPYAKSTGNAQILLQGDDAQEMAAQNSDWRRSIRWNSWPVISRPKRRKSLGSNFLIIGPAALSRQSQSAATGRSQICPQLSGCISS